MKPEDYTQLLEQAVASEYGITLHVGTDELTLPLSYPQQRIRRQLYEARDRARRAGNHSFDGLSIITRMEEGQVWIIKREFVQNPPRDDGLGLPSGRTLAVEELPERIAARGPSKN